MNNIKNNSLKSYDISKFELKNRFIYFEGHLYVLKDKIQLHIF